MTDPKVVHPTTQNRIDFRNHILHGPADLLPEDLPELFKQRGSLLQRWRIVWPPLSPKAKDAPILKTQESKALFFLRSTIRLLSSLIATRSFANSSRSRLSTAFTSQSLRRSASIKITISSAKRAYWTLVDLPLRVVCTAFFQHPVYLIQIEVTEQR
jgi:hypothetical protein